MTLNAKKFLVILCGASGSGKSTMSVLLAVKLNISKVLSTDHIRGMLRVMLDPVKDKDEYEKLLKSTYMGDDPVESYQSQSQVIQKYFKKWMAQEMENRNESILIEGTHLDPLFIEAQAPEWEKQYTVVPIFLAVDTDEEQRKRFLTRAKKTETGSDKYVDNYEKIKKLREYLRSRAEKSSIHITLNEGTIEETTQSLYNHVISKSKEE